MHSDNILREKDFSLLPTFLQSLCSSSSPKVCLVTDSHVAPLYLKDVNDALSKDFPMAKPFIFPAGEESKQLSTVSELYQHLIQEKIERSDLLLALGGGVVGDLCGFAAATYRRGIRYMQIPTTVLSQVDSSMGGKTGVDFSGYKNMIGAFYLPLGIYMNIATLQTLEEEQFLSGLGEVVKTACIARADLFTDLEEQRSALVHRDPDLLLHIIRICGETKESIVAEDPQDHGIRKILNFGHTIGHAIESCSHFSMPHGYCVSIGMAAAARLSERRGLLTKKDVDRISDLLASLDLPLSVSGLSEDIVWQAMQSDKKQEQGKLHFILLEEIGKAIPVTDLQEEVLRETIREVL